MGFLPETVVRQSVTKFNGMVTWPYSQGDWATLNIIIRNRASMFGICKSLSAQWIVDHAYGGALYNRVVGANGKINESAITKIRNDFCMLIQGDQEAATSEWLRARGVIQRAGSGKPIEYDVTRKGVRMKGFKGTQTSRREMMHSGEADPNVPLKCAQHFAKIHQRESKYRMSGSYCMISFAGGGSMGHAVAAWIANDACFFEPNFGEFYFEDASDFVKWYPTFMALGYKGGMSHSWTVTEYGLAIQDPEVRHARNWDAVQTRGRR